jgi:hypothetical protein
MISAALLKRSFRRRASDRVIYRSARRVGGELVSRPRVEYENRELYPVVVRQRSAVRTDGGGVSFTNSLRGIYMEGEIEITWNPNEAVTVRPGDRINIGGMIRPDGSVEGGEDHEIHRHSKTERVHGFIMQKFNVARIITADFLKEET